ncbi:hypothetical protein L833_3327 [Mycobacteroides abscessus MAB_091912_2446]|uniref:Uncharacterized protein n=1 Tax=Mycobacteroides abscessus MAB_091912_2446 TaxID=1335414 RepID=A0A829MIE4_9MYCO|nr:hypothetical protein L833_3327 [Mycobacteroides abscessus MAB_091912_2446]
MDAMTASMSPVLGAGSDTAPHSLRLPGAVGDLSIVVPADSHPPR